jgi:nucleotide-binding universal stress UspA family protein
MSAERNVLSIRRILVALDASPHSQAALDAAVELATRFQAELAGLFVEDQNLLRLAGLPFVSEVGIFTATRRRMDSEQIERQIRVQSRRVRQIFTVTTEQARLHGSFRVVRGAVLQEVLNAADDADVLVLGKAGWSLFRHGQLGSTVRGLLPERYGLTLILHQDNCLGPPLAVLYDGSPASGRALLAAASLNARLDEAPALIVLLLVPDSTQVENLQKLAATLLDNPDLPIRYYALTRAHALQLAGILHEEDCGILVLPARSAALQHQALVDLLEKINLPVLLVT